MTVMFDTLKLARRLESVGFSPQQASGAAEALAESFSTEVASKSDVDGVRLEIESARLGLQSALHTEIAGVKTETAKLRADLTEQIANARAGLSQWILTVFVGLLLAYVGGILTLWQIFRR